MSLVVGASVLETLRLHVEGSYPNEACGLLVGRLEAATLRVTRAHPLENRSASPGRGYEIAPEDFLWAERRARDEGLDVIGVFHSHPDRDPSPSSRDLHEAWPFYVYWIGEVRKGALISARAWRLGAAGFDELPVQEGAAA